MKPLIKIGSKITDEEIILPGSSGEKGTGLETDVPDLEKKIQKQQKIKLVKNMP